jgi:hypothetical protein
MRRLAQPDVVNSAALAALICSIACLPRLILWPERPFSLWYLEATLFVGGFVLWAFVFAWHTEYTRRPVFTTRIPARDFALATFVGVAVALSLMLTLDPVLEVRTPQDYPSNILEWIAKTLFGLAFLQLFLTFAPFAWLVRLFKNSKLAFVLTVLFGLVVLALKHERSPDPAPPTLFAALLVTRIAIGSISLWLYLRGGLLLTWWWGVLLEARHLLGILDDPG